MSWQLQMCGILTAINVYIYFTVQPPRGHFLHTSLMASFIMSVYVPIGLYFGWVTI